MDNYTPNSHKYRDETEKKNIQKIVTGDVTTKKKSKFREAFISDDAENVGSYIVSDILVPAIKRMIADMVTTGMDIIFFGGSRSGSKNGPTSTISYSSYYNNGRSRYSVPEKSYSYNEIIIKNRGEAEAVLEGMDDLIDRYKMASIADLYEFVGITGNYTDNNYGWTDLRNAGIRRVRDGYLLELPRAKPLN